LTFPCALGKSGIIRRKREGDGGTPAGRFRVLRLWWRNDQGKRPRTSLPLRITTRNDSWCDDARSPRYNRPVKLPFALSHEKMWRDDHLYDLVVELDCNMRPAIRGRGSAIFMHVARPGFLPTEGCIALEKRVLKRLLAHVGKRTVIDIA
jgi:L,D-peptidoglycan transpeptidase YkuD (ErfK/YbiS/YcfS/YnhG family)